MKYTLKNVATGILFEDTGWLLDDPQAQSASLIRAVYDEKQLNVDANDNSLYRFADWLPTCKTLEGSSAPITYKSEGLAKKLGLSNLYIIFNGYFPEKGVAMKSCSFKETEAYSVCARQTPFNDKVLVIASAGNTARAFANVCSENNIPLLLCVPEDCLHNLWFDRPLNECVKLITTEKGSDYFDAINLGNIAVKSPRFYAEGGAKNIARRDGMGTTTLSAVTTIGRIPDYYFQAIGSGTGAVAAWEANLRLIEDGRFGSNKMQLMLSQNSPFQPMYDAWNKYSRELLPMDDDLARKQVIEINAKVLSNRRPPYSIAGGVFDAMVDAGGKMYSMTNTQAAEAAKLFEETEGNDINIAAAVAVASLIEAVNNDDVDTKAYIALNITGGGERKFKTGKNITNLQSSHIFPCNPTDAEVIDVIEKLF